jgi:hypothetical protein
LGAPLAALHAYARACCLGSQGPVLRIHCAYVIIASSIHIYQERVRSLAKQGDVNNLVVMIRFSNHAAQDRVLPGVQTYDTVLNTGGDARYTPVGSVRGASW